MLQSAAHGDVADTIDHVRERPFSRIRIGVVYRRERPDKIPAHDMSVIRWLRMSEGLSYTGFSVDVIVSEGDVILQRSPGLRIVPRRLVNWDDYHVVKTLFHAGYQALKDYGGDSHPYIVSKLGSVVGAHDGVEGVYFFGEERESLFAIQREIARNARYVNILTRASRELWRREHGFDDNVLMVPTGVDRTVPPAGRNPYTAFDEPVAVYIGNFYAVRQREINRFWQERFNELGAALKRRKIRFCVVGNGVTDMIDPRVVTYLGPIEHQDIWDYQYHADVGVVLAQGSVQHNESSKIYYYLRAGLPVVSESPVPNNHLIDRTGLGYVCDFKDTDMFADLVEAAAAARWDKRAAIDHMVANHTWDLRVQDYRQLLCRDFGFA